VQRFIPMEVHDQSRVRAWRIVLVLLVFYAIYVPHLFLTIFVTPAGHSLAGPWKGWEVLLDLVCSTGCQSLCLAICPSGLPRCCSRGISFDSRSSWALSVSVCARPCTLTS